MLEDLRRRIIMFNIIILLLFLSMLFNISGEELYIHISLLVGVVILSLVFVVIDGNESQ